MTDSTDLATAPFPGLLCQHNFQDIWRRKARAKLEALTFDPQQQAGM